MVQPGFLTGITCRALVACIAALVLRLCLAQTAQAADKPAQPGSAGSADDSTTAGYGSVQGFGGPAAVGPQTEADHTRKHTTWRFDGATRFVQPYFDFKAKTKEETGLVFGGDYNALYQNASNSPGENHAAGGTVRLFGTWQLFDGDSGRSGALVAKVENRHRLGTDIPPQSLASEIGYAGLTAVTFSDAGNLLTNLYWDQSFGEDKVAFIAGIVDVTDYVDIYGLVNPWVDFANLAYSTDPTIPAPDQGLGAAVRVHIADNYYMLAGLADSNGDPGDPGDSFDSFFGDHEYFKHIEIGWVGSRDSSFTDNLHLLLWQADKRTGADAPRGWGATVSFSRKVTENWMPFARVAYSDGGGGVFLDRSLSGGVGYFLSDRSDVIGLGAAWGRPSKKTFGSGLDDQYTLEAFYRLQLFQHMTLSADVQLLVDPAFNPTQSSTWVFGTGGRLSF